MKQRIPTLDLFIAESILNEGTETVTLNKETYTVDFIKQKSHDGVVWDLLLKNVNTGELLAWPAVFSYTEGWSQGTNRSERGYYLQTKFYGGSGNGSGRSSASTPSYIYRELESIKEYIEGTSYEKEANQWFASNVRKYPKGTKKTEIQKDLS
jgi:hypothetical protein